MRDRLMDILGDVVDDAEEGRVTEEGFNFFSVTWSAVSEAIRDRLTAARETPAASAPSSARGAGGWGMDEPMQRPESGDDA
jgi:hypothetical protein